MVVVVVFVKQNYVRCLLLLTLPLGRLIARIALIHTMAFCYVERMIAYLKLAFYVSLHNWKSKLWMIDRAYLGRTWRTLLHTTPGGTYARHEAATNRRRNS